MGAAVFALRNEMALHYADISEFFAAGNFRFGENFRGIADAF
jgi:hypothetical protein